MYPIKIFALVGIILSIIVLGNGASVNKSSSKRLCPCPKHYFPICGSDNNTYDNECELRCNRQKNPNLTVKHIGECNIVVPCECHLDYSPVCGSDGITYSNLCLLRCMKMRNKNLEATHTGECIGASKSNIF